MPPLRFQLLRTVCRFAFHLAAGFSALALVVCLILWPLSYRRTMDLRYVTSGGSAYALGGGGGRLWAEHSHVFARGAGPGLTSRFTPLDPRYTAWSFTAWIHEKSPGGSAICDSALGGVWFRSPNTSAVAVPLLYLTLLAAILPAFWLRWFRRERQARFARPGFPVEPAAPAR